MPQFTAEEVRDYILFSQAVARTRQMLDPHRRVAFVEAVRHARSIADVPFPYADWILTPSSSLPPPNYR